MSIENSDNISPISRYAIIVDPKDNVAVVKEQIAPGTLVKLPDGHIVCVTGSVTPGHRFATRRVAAGEFVLQYGQPIGTSMDIGEGDPILRRNMTNDVPVRRDLPDDLYNAPPDYIPHEECATFL